MSISDELEQRLVYVADHLGEMLCREVVFVGGCVTGLLVTDPVSRQSIRMTEDVDLIVDVLGWPRYVELQESLRARGFREAMNEDVLCRWRLDGLIVDVMPVDEKILKFTNRWYKGAIQSAQTYEFRDGICINVVSRPYFIATKMEAYKGRGGGDFIGSRDIEDIFMLIDGCDQLEEEVATETGELIRYISATLSSFKRERDYESVLQSTTQGYADRSRMLMDRVERLIKLN